MTARIKTSAAAKAKPVIKLAAPRMSLDEVMSALEKAGSAQTRRTYIEKTWAHATTKNFASPAAQERNRESMRTRC